jgi:hypothetical protein
MTTSRREHILQALVTSLNGLAGVAHIKLNPTRREN